MNSSQFTMSESSTGRGGWGGGLLEARPGRRARFWFCGLNHRGAEVAEGGRGLATDCTDGHGVGHGGVVFCFDPCGSVSSVAGFGLFVGVLPHAKAQRRKAKKGVATDFADFTDFGIGFEIERMVFCLIRVDPC